MKTTKIISIIVTIILLISASKCEEFPMNPICIENKSEFIIIHHIPWLVIMNNCIIYPDTALSILQKYIGGDTQPNDTRCFEQLNSTYEYWFSSFPNDTISIYLFNKDTVDMYDWEIVQRDYKILQRYDLSLADIYALKEKNGPVITYPPDERMKNMKMYPPYGE
jgi:hypothetical protein